MNVNHSSRVKKITTNIISTINIVIPSFEKWFIVLLIGLYVLESCTNATRRYLDNALSSQMDVERYIEQLRHARPVVQWNVRCFHYEKREFLNVTMNLLDVKGWMIAFWQKKRQQQQQRDQEGVAGGGGGGVDGETTTTGESLRASLLTRKVVTHTASKEYEFSSWKDKTTTGIWQRSIYSPSISTAPFTKITLSKMLVLKDVKSREDYFLQQAHFVSKEGRRDEYAEFSTNINVKGFKPRMLAVRPVQGVSSTKLFRIHLYWFFTLIGLTLPFRMWFSKHCDVVRVTVVKETSSKSSLLKKKKKKAYTSIADDDVDDENSGDGKASSLSSWIYSPKRWYASSGSANMSMDEMQSENARAFREAMEEFSLYESPSLKNDVTGTDVD